MPQYEDFTDVARLDCLSTCPEIAANQCAIRNLERFDDAFIQAEMQTDPTVMAEIVQETGYTIQIPTGYEDDPAVREQLLDLVRKALQPLRENVRSEKQEVVIKGLTTALACADGPLSLRVDFASQTHDIALCTSKERPLDDYGNVAARHEIS